MPTSTWLGGAVGVPRPVRMKPRTIEDAREAGDAEQQRRDERERRRRASAAGRRCAPSCDAVHRRHRPARAARRGTSAAAAPRPRRRRGRASARRRARGQQAQRARLVLGVGADRRDAVLGDADQHELAAGAHQVQRAVGAERQRGLGAQARCRVALLACEALICLQHPGQAVDDGDDDGQADERAGQASRRRLAGAVACGALRGAGSAACSRRAWPRCAAAASAARGSGSRSRDAAASAAVRAARVSTEGQVLGRETSRKPGARRPRLTRGPRPVGARAAAAAARPRRRWRRSVMRRPNCSSITTTSPRAIGLPLTSRSTGSPAMRSSVTTEPGPSAIVSPSVMRVRPISTASSTVTSVRRRRSPARRRGRRGAPGGVQSASRSIRARHRRSLPTGRRRR